MPKETKRFINPLLRPSVEVETKREEVQTQPEQHIPAEKTSSDTSTNTPTAMVRETIATSQTVESPPYNVPQSAEPHLPARKQVAQPSTETSTYQTEVEQQRKPRRGELPSSTREVPTALLQTEMPQGESTIPYTSSAVPGYVDNVMADSRRSAPADRPVSYSPSMMPSPATQTSTFPSTSHTIEWEPSSSSTPAQPLLEPSFSSTSTYTSVEQDTSLIDEEQDEVTERAPYSPPRASRRRRGAQAFEKTHERITLWIDKRLKQGFEELAYDQEASKTSLLNEAIADLLRKYASH